VLLSETIFVHSSPLLTALAEDKDESEECDNHDSELARTISENQVFYEDTVRTSLSSISKSAGRRSNERIKSSLSYSIRYQIF
jgi:hypothetical protein